MFGTSNFEVLGYLPLKIRNFWLFFAKIPKLLAIFRQKTQFFWLFFHPFQLEKFQILILILAVPKKKSQLLV